MTAEPQVLVKEAPRAVPPVDKAVDISLPPPRRSAPDRPRRIVLRLAEGTTTVPNLVREFRLSRQRVHKIATAAEERGELERIIGRHPAMWRAGPNLASLTEEGHMRHVDAPPCIPVRFHAAQAKMPIDASHADLRTWKPWRSKSATFRGWARTVIRTNTGIVLKVDVRGSILVVNVPEITVPVPIGDVNTVDMGISKAVDTFRSHVSDAVKVARRICREKFNIHTQGPPTWYRPPHFALERFPGLPKAARYTIEYVWVDASTGHTEAETSSLPALRDLMRIAAGIHAALSTLSTPEDMPISGSLTS